MIRQHIKYAIRSLKKDKKSSIFLISGLSISLVAVLLIALWVTDELTFNRMFSKSGRTYQLVASFDSQSDQFIHSTPAPIATVAAAEIPAIEAVCRTQRSRMTTFVRGTSQFDENGLFADPSFLQVFDLPATYLHNDTPFSQVQSIVLTKTFASKFFPEGNALGQTIELELDWIVRSGKEPFVVSAIVDDFPENSSLKGSFILPYTLLKRIKGENYEAEWGNFQNDIFIVLKDGHNPSTVARQFTDIQQQQFGPAEEPGQNGLYADFAYYLQNIETLHLYNPKGKQQGMLLVYSVLGLGLVILAISCSNYVSLVTAKATKRGKEISLRKIVGASKKHLFIQYLLESGLIFGVALLCAMVLTYLTLPFFNELTEKNLKIDVRSYEVYLIGAVTFLSTLLLAGMYPALLFSSNKLVQLIKSGRDPHSASQKVRKALVIVQFTSTIILITGTLVFQKQIQFMRQKDLGYSKENVFLFEQKNFLPHYDAVRSELERQPGIAGVTAASSDVTDFGSETADIDWKGKSSKQSNFFITQVGVDRNFTQVLGISLASGEGFSGTAADSSKILLNEQAIQEMGLADPVGQTITFRGKTMTIAGVMKNFNFKDLKTEIKPCAFFLGNGFALGGMYVKAQPNKIDEALVAVQTLWRKYNPEHPLRYHFLDEAFAIIYKEDLLSAKLISIFSLLAIVLSCTGLASLILFSTELKVKEIGIRKTLGASVQSIILLLTKEYMRLIVLSIVVAFPIAWLLANRWLENYVYRTTLDWWIFLLSGAAIIALALLSATKIAIQAARANPVHALKNDD
ncbi:ABC transporter permease [Sphingobacterium suaedae]|uniref:ABC transporter permease n=1 Tax=Sphingobacterium suaedae TaxID=1686402 RepID=A0ABW5KKY4_9SPHI